MSQRGSSKSGRLEDEQRKGETQPFVDGAPVEARGQFHRQETAGPGEPDMSPGRRPLTAQPAGGQSSIDEANKRAEFAAPMWPTWFPLKAEVLKARLEAAHAPEWIVARVAGIDPGARVKSPGHAWDLSSDA